MHTLQPEKLTKLQKSQKICVEGDVMALDKVGSLELILKSMHVEKYCRFSIQCQKHFLQVK